jgi:hypothetical protein
VGVFGDQIRLIGVVPLPRGVRRQRESSAWLSTRSDGHVLLKLERHTKHSVEPKPELYLIAGLESAYASAFGTLLTDLPDFHAEDQAEPIAFAASLETLATVIRHFVEPCLAKMDRPEDQNRSLTLREITVDRRQIALSFGSELQPNVARYYVDECMLALCEAHPEVIGPPVTLSFESPAGG